MKKQIAKLSAALRSSSSDEEFWMKAAVEGASFTVELLFRLCLFRRRHPSCEWLELMLFGLCIVGFSVWGALVGPKNPLGAVGVILLALAVLIPLELLVMKFEEFCHGLFEKDG